VSKGYAVANVNYRLIQHAVFPAQIEDYKAAVRWLRANATKHNPDPDHISGTGRPTHAGTARCARRAAASELLINAALSRFPGNTFGSVGAFDRCGAASFDVSHSPHLPQPHGNRSKTAWRSFLEPLPSVCPVCVQP
jgi:hypothetical protein